MTIDRNYPIAAGDLLFHNHKEWGGVPYCSEDKVLFIYGGDVVMVIDYRENIAVGDGTYTLLFEESIIALNQQTILTYFSFLCP